MSNTRIRRIVALRLPQGGCDFGEVHRAPRYRLTSIFFKLSNRVIGVGFIYDFILKFEKKESHI